MSGITRTTSYSELHYNLITNLCKSHRLGFSEVVRRLIDFALDRDPTLGLPFHEDRRKSLQAELLSVEETIKALEVSKATDSSKVFVETRTCNSVTSESSRASPKAPTVDNRPGQTEEERFLKATPYVAREDTVVTPDMKARVLAQARDHPEWLEKVKEPEKTKLETMLKKSKIGGQ